MSYRILHRDRTAALERACPECGATMKGTGDLYWNATGWYVAFLCAKEGEIFPTWAPEYVTLIDELTRGVEPATLPATGDE